MTELTKSKAEVGEAGRFHRSIGLLSATSINMTQMCGIGPFITIPIMIATMGGPQAILGWIVGAVLALTDGLVYAELGAAMPGAGGTYVYLREAFQYRTGKLMPFLFAWTALISIPLIMSTGAIGIVQYLRVLLPVDELGHPARDRRRGRRADRVRAVPADRVDPHPDHRARGSSCS